MRHVIVALIVAVLGLIIAQPATTSAQEEGPDRVYFEETGQYLADEFLDFWREYGGIHTFGYPISPVMTEDGMTVQYFERHILEHHPDNPEDYQVLLRRLGAEAATERELRQHDAFDEISDPDASGTRYFPETGHAVEGEFLDYWENNGGIRIFGYPMSTEFEHGGLTVQFFERAIFEWHPDNPDEWQVLYERLGAQAADLAGIDRSPQEHDGDVPHYSPDLWTAPEPEPGDATGGIVPPPGAPSDHARWIEVDLTNQMVRAWQGEQLVFSAIAATGRPAVPTLTGQWETYVHLRYDDMSGTTPDQGDYHLPDVPYVMYYDRGYAIHGTYWHSNFGSPQSAGCVNLTIEDARWLFNWAHVGTTVFVHGHTPGA